MNFARSALCLLKLDTYLLENIGLCKYMCEKFVAFGLILRLKLLPKPSGLGPLDVRVNQTFHEIYVLKSPNGMPVAA